MAEPVTTSRRKRPAVFRRLSTAEAVVGGLMLAVIFALVLMQAAQRYLPAGGWVWTGELARYCLVWLTLAMSGHLTARDGHVTLKLADTVVGGRSLRLVAAFANTMVAIVCLNLVYEAYSLATSDSEQVSPAMGMPLQWLYVIPLAGLLLTAVHAVVAVFWPDPETGGHPPHDGEGAEEEEASA